MGRIVQFTWITNVLKALLDVRGPQLPGGFGAEVRAVFDVSRRDPELMKEIGIMPWSVFVDGVAVVGEFSFADFAVAAGFVVVVDRLYVVDSGVVFGPHWSNTGLTAPLGQPVFSTDSRLTVASLGEGLTVSADSVVAVPGNRIWKNASGLGSDARNTPPLVLGGPTAGVNHLQVFNESLANQRLWLSASGYLFRVPRQG